MKKIHLLTPGPTVVPSSIREVLSKEIIHHRTDEFREILHRVHTGLQEVFCTKNPVVVFSSSGTGAMEAAVANFCSQGDKIVAVVGGKFGKRWAEIGYAYGLRVLELNVEWGMSPSPEDLRKMLESNSDVKAVFTTLCETSTATVYDIEKIAEVIKEREVILVVDAISGLGQDKLLTDHWNVDVVVGGSQKGFMLPPGLSFMSISEKARRFLDNSNLPKYYFNLKKALKSYEKSDTPFTPAVSLIRGLEKSLEVIIEEGLEKRWERFKRLSYATQSAAKAIGLEVFSKSPSSSVTAISIPKIPTSSIVKKLRKEYGLSIAGGQEHLKDKIIRIAHMGAIDIDDLMVGFSFLEKVLREEDYKFKLGTSLAKLQEVYYA